MTCGVCGSPLPDGARFCPSCGAVVSQEAATSERKIVTVLFADLVDSTGLSQRLDPERAREVLGRFYDVTVEELVALRGKPEKFIGDAMMAVFGLPRVHEDDALRAVRAAAEMRDHLAALNSELEERWGVTVGNRTGVNTGEVVAGDPTTGQRLVTGDTVNTAARLEQAAGRNEVLIGPLTRELVAHMTDLEAVEPLELKGKSEPMPAFRLLGVRAAAARAHVAPLVGRGEELQTLRSELSAV